MRDINRHYSYSRIPEPATGTNLPWGKTTILRMIGIREHGHSIAFNFAKEKGVSKPVAEEILSQT
jgi:hypothetical protein